MTVAAKGAATALPQRGFALLIVLWSLVLLSLLATELTATGRAEARLALNLRGAAIVQAAADGAIAEAAFHVIDSTAAHWPADGLAHRIEMNAATVLVTVTSEAGKLNPNDAQPELMQALLHQLGADTQTAHALAIAIADWTFPGDQPHPGGAKAIQYKAAGLPYGPPGQPLQTLGELGLVIGMTPQLLDRLLPYLTLYHDGPPEAGRAGAPMRAALQEASGGVPPAGGNGQDNVVTITSTATDGNGSRFTRQAVVRAGAARITEPGLYQVLTWQTL